MRRGLPRWARGTRLKPRAPAKPAAPSLLQLIKDDDHWAVQERICVPPSVLGEVSPHGDFFQEQWPKLLRAACQHLSDRCIGMLVGLKTQGADSPPPLPAHALGWLMEGAKRKEIAGPLLENRPGVQALVERMAQSPISLRKADGIRLMELGGAAWLFSTSNLSPSKCTNAKAFYQEPVFAQAWQQWCGRTSHIEDALGFIAQTNFPEAAKRSWLTTRAIREFLHAVPAKHHEHVRTRIAEDLLSQGAAWRMDANHIGLMGWWLKQFDAMGWDTDHQVWKVWAKHTMMALSSPPTQPPSHTVVATEWVRILLYQEGLNRPLPGWSWNLLVQANVLGALSPGMKNLLERPDSMGQVWNQAATWLREILELEQRLVQLGLREDNPQAWQQAIDNEVGVGWENQLEELLISTVDLAETHLLERRWAQWKQRRLSLALDEPAMPRGPRPRM